MTSSITAYPDSPAQTPLDVIGPRAALTMVCSQASVVFLGERMPPNSEQPQKLRQRVPWLPLSGIVLVVLFTLASAAGNMAPSHIPTRDQRRKADLENTIMERRERIEERLRVGDRCEFAVARELARDLVYDGRSAVAYADDYARRCGDDPIVRRWAEIGLRFPRTVGR